MRSGRRPSSWRWSRELTSVPPIFTVSSSKKRNGHDKGGGAHLCSADLQFPRAKTKKWPTSRWRRREISLFPPICTVSSSKNTLRRVDGLPVDVGERSHFFRRFAQFPRAKLLIQPPVESYWDANLLSGLRIKLMQKACPETFKILPHF